MPNFLEVDDTIITSNLRLNGQPQNPKTILDSLVGGGDLNSSKLLTPEEKKAQENCKFIIPIPGLCVKTKDNRNGTKFFMNLCHSDDVPEPELDYTDDQLATLLDDGSDAQIDDIRLPMSIGELHKDKDKNGSECIACDVVINTNFFQRKITQSEMYRTFLLVVAFEGVDEKHKLELEKSKYTILHNRKNFGKLNPQFVRQKASIREIKETSVIKPLDHESPMTDSMKNIKRPRLVQEVSASDLKLDCVITRLSSDLAKAEIKLPNLRNPSKLFVKLGADRIIVESPNGCLDIFVPLDIHQEESMAEYNPETKLLTIRIKILY